MAISKRPDSSVTNLGLRANSVDASVFAVLFTDRVATCQTDFLRVSGTRLRSCTHNGAFTVSYTHVGTVTYVTWLPAGGAENTGREIAGRETKGRNFRA